MVSTWNTCTRSAARSAPETRLRITETTFRTITAQYAIAAPRLVVPAEVKDEVSPQSELLVLRVLHGLEPAQHSRSGHNIANYVAQSTKLRPLTIFIDETALSGNECHLRLRASRSGELLNAAAGDDSVSHVKYGGKE